jgi:oligoribonuclease
MPREDKILFLDLETTGVDEHVDEIIEVGIVMLDATKDNYPEIGSYTHVLIPSDNAFRRMDDKQVVRDMHKKNGLYDTIVSLTGRDLRNQLSYSPNFVDKDIVEWIKTFVGSDSTQIPYGGSGVAHFDRRFIKRYLPRFDKMITHWALDVGVLRRSFVKAGVTPADVVLESQGQEKDHRALQDARVHADEWRYYQRFIKGDL